MSEPSSLDDLQRARLKAIARRALADAWARGLKSNQAEQITAEILQKKFPEISAQRVFELIQAVRRNAK
jgi:hypothetical protein